MPGRVRSIVFAILAAVVLIGRAAPAAAQGS